MRKLLPSSRLSSCTRAAARAEAFDISIIQYGTRIRFFLTAGMWKVLQRIMKSNPKTKQQGVGGLILVFTFHRKTLEGAADCRCCWINSWGELAPHNKVSPPPPQQGLVGIILSWMSWIHIEALLHFNVEWHQAGSEWICLGVVTTLRQ